MRYGFSQSSKLALTLLDALPRLHRAGDIDDVGEDSVDLAVHIPGGRIEEVQIQVLGTRATLQVQWYLMPYERFSGAENAVEQIDKDLSFHLRKSHLDRSSEHGVRRAVDQALIVGIDPLKYVLGPAQHCDGGWNLCQQ